jgi:MFS family permease
MKCPPEGPSTAWCPLHCWQRQLTVRMLDTTRYNLSSFQSGTVVSSSLLGALAGSGGAFAFGDRLGRRGELLLAAVLYGAA